MTGAGVPPDAELDALKRDIHKHADAIDGYDGSLNEHGPCLVCAALAGVGEARPAQPHEDRCTCEDDGPEVPCPWHLQATPGARIKACALAIPHGPHDYSPLSWCPGVRFPSAAREQEA